MSVSVRVCIYISMHPVNTYTNKPFLLIKTVQTLESKLCGLLFFFLSHLFYSNKKKFFFKPSILSFPECYYLDYNGLVSFLADLLLAFIWM